MQGNYDRDAKELWIKDKYFLSSLRMDEIKNEERDLEKRIWRLFHEDKYEWDIPFKEHEENIEDLEKDVPHEYMMYYPYVRYGSKKKAIVSEEEVAQFYDELHNDDLESKENSSSPIVYHLVKRSDGTAAFMYHICLKNTRHSVQQYIYTGLMYKIRKRYHLAYFMIRKHDSRFDTKENMRILFGDRFKECSPDADTMVKIKSNIGYMRLLSNERKNRIIIHECFQDRDRINDRINKLERMAKHLQDELIRELARQIVKTVEHTRVTVWDGDSTFDIDPID
ncbi:hypothetical protein K502DRAFT_346735 [Neoconidiobolus thromboides FSU 785]|nr:hypothetical protein K502DRAFT_346735 [Neoconidiobolus thromboides FSU 785]